MPFFAKEKKVKVLAILLFIVLVVLIPKPCGKFRDFTPFIEYKCYGIKTKFYYYFTGGPIFCFGICNYVKKEPDFTCVEASDCISGCGWKAGHGGCVAVNKIAKDYLEKNRLNIEHRFPLICFQNSCAFKVKDDLIIGFQVTKEGEIIPYNILEPEMKGGYLWRFLGGF